MSEMVDRVAHAITDQLETASVYSIARTAIAAMREPTEAMVDAGEKDMLADCVDDCARTWKAMIDAALQEPAAER